MTEKLIDHLVADLSPTRRSTLVSWTLAALAVGAIIAAAFMVPWIGLRTDIATAPTTLMFWVKFGYTLLAGLIGISAALALSRPDGKARTAPVIGAALLGLAIVLGLGQLAMAPPELRAQLVIGGTALVCPFYIVALSSPILALLLAAARRYAPQSPTRAGFAIGLAAGGFGAFVYAFHCGENGMMFMAIWYSLGILAVASLGAVAGRYLLRW